MTNELRTRLEEHTPEDGVCGDSDLRFCECCEALWPCDASLALARIDALAADLVAAQDELSVVKGSAEEALSLLIQERDSCAELLAKAEADLTAERERWTVARLTAALEPWQEALTHPESGTKAAATLFVGMPHDFAAAIQAELDKPEVAG